MNNLNNNRQNKLLFFVIFPPPKCSLEAQTLMLKPSLRE